LPVSWQRVQGHESLIEAFDRVVRRGRLAHAYLFAGPSGVGKRLFAHELARALLCEGKPGPRLEACDRCPSCAQVDAGSHPDFFVAARPEENVEFPIAVVQQLCRDLSLKPARGRRKIAIVDDADDFNAESANCFLKTLEEPPPNSLLILIGTSSDLQLPTIVSRCQVIHFAPLSENIVADLLRKEGLEDPALIQRVAQLSDGSLGQALALADPALWEFRRTLLTTLAKSPFDSVALAQAWTHFVEEAGKDSAAQRRRAALLIGLLIDFLDVLLVVQNSGAPKLAEAEDRRILEDLAQRTNQDQVLALLDRCLEASVQLDRKVQLILVIEALVDALGQKLEIQV
jgi:DNA polymerase-3 subunit delta'